MRLLKVAVSCKDSFANFHVDLTGKCFVAEAVVFDNVLWEETERHFHILILVKWHCKIHVFNVSAGKTSTFGADGAVPKDF